VPKGAKEIKLVNPTDQEATVFVRVMEVNEAPAAAEPAETKAK
jgi:hypothetical protein